MKTACIDHPGVDFILVREDEIEISFSRLRHNRPHCHATSKKIMKGLKIKFIANFSSLFSRYTFLEGSVVQGSDTGDH